MPGMFDFHKYCREVAELEGRLDEIESPIVKGDGYSEYEIEIYWRIWRRDFLDRGDGALLARGENIRNRSILVILVYVPVVFATCVLPFIL
jgi:hypothetical protein